MEEAIGLGREAGDDGLDGAQVVHLVEEALLEHGLIVDGGVLGLLAGLLGLRLGLAGVHLGLVVLVLLLGRLLGPLLLALLQLALGHHLARLVVEHELGRILATGRGRRGSGRGRGRGSIAELQLGGRVGDGVRHGDVVWLVVGLGV